MQTRFSNELNARVNIPSNEEKITFDVIALEEFDANFYSENDGFGYWGVDYGYCPDHKVGLSHRPPKCDRIWWLSK